jgi:hypothetical protein
MRANRALVVVALLFSARELFAGSRARNASMSAQRADAGASVTARCGDVVGAWSPVVGGLRGRLVTSGSRADRSALRLALELENVSGRGPLEVNWNGSIQIGFAAFELADATGALVPEPAWRWGGNESVGHARVIMPSSGVVQFVVADNLFAPMMGRRAMRLGAFWGREMPTDGSRRFLRARVTGVAPPVHTWVQVEIPAVDGGGMSVRAAAPDEPSGHTWIGTLDVPAVCVD